MRIVVTGITGFIGMNFCRELNQDNDYIFLVRESSDYSGIEEKTNITIRKVDFLRDDLELELRDADVVVHMIGQMGGYGVALEKFETVNCHITEKMVNACKDAGVKQFVYVSTPGVQGFGKRLSREEEPYAPRNAYEKTKVRAEEIVMEALKSTAVKYTIIRPDFVYGPGDLRRVKMYKNIRDKKFVLTTSGKSYLHPTYVMDVVQGINCSIGNEAAYNEIFNISALEDVTVEEYLKTIANYFNVSLIKINIGYNLSCIAATMIDVVFRTLLKKEGFVSKNKIDFLAIDHSTSNEKARKKLNYQPEYNFKKGFNATMKWYEENNIM